MTDEEIMQDYEEYINVLIDLYAQDMSDEDIEYLDAADLDEIGEYFDYYNE